MRMLVVFEKGALLRHIGHLDLMRAMQRALRRSEMPIAYSQGFNPHILNTFASALSVGMAGEREIMDVKLTTSCDAGVFHERLQKALPPAIVIKEVITVQDTQPAPMALLRAAEYEIRFLEEDGQTVIAQIPALLERSAIQAVRKTKSGMKPCDIRPMIHALRAEEGRINMLLSASEQATCKPELVLKALAEQAGVETLPKYFATRLQLYGVDANAALVPLERLA